MSISEAADTVVPRTEIIFSLITSAGLFGILHEHRLLFAWSTQHMIHVHFMTTLTKLLPACFGIEAIRQGSKQSNVGNMFRLQDPVLHYW